MGRGRAPRAFPASKHHSEDGRAPSLRNAAAALLAGLAPPASPRGEQEQRPERGAARGSAPLPTAVILSKADSRGKDGVRTGGNEAVAPLRAPHGDGDRPEGFVSCSSSLHRLPAKGTRALGWPFLEVSLPPSQRVTQASFPLNDARGEDAGRSRAARKPVTCRGAQHRAPLLLVPGFKCCTQNLHCSSPRGPVEVYLGGVRYKKCFVPAPHVLLLLFFSVPGNSVQPKPTRRALTGPDGSIKYKCGDKNTDIPPRD